MVRAIWNDTVIAESDETVVVEGNHYFPPQSVNRDHLRESSATTVCGWKGTAHYYDVVVDGQTNPGAAWHYPEPMEAAKHIQHRIAFWKGVEVQEG
jgi:uncharacterized protein (DUF427 family)